MTPKRDRVAKAVRARIEHGDYADGQHLIQDKLAAEYCVNRDVVWFALGQLQKERFTSLVSHRYLVNATPSLPTPARVALAPERRWRVVR
jgi:DNA-binding GntR family transcriptional regulator